MPVDSAYCNASATEKHLVLSFEEGDDILACIESALRGNGIREARVVGARGRIRSGSGMYLLKNSMKTRTFADTPIRMATGHFKLLGDGLSGALKVVAMDRADHVTLARTFASEGFELRLSYYEYGGPALPPPMEPPAAP